MTIRLLQVKFDPTQDLMMANDEDDNNIDNDSDYGSFDRRGTADDAATAGSGIYFAKMISLGEADEDDLAPPPPPRPPPPANYIPQHFHSLPRNAVLRSQFLRNNFDDNIPEFTTPFDRFVSRSNSSLSNLGEGR